MVVGEPILLVLGISEGICGASSLKTSTSKFGYKMCLEFDVNVLKRAFFLWTVTIDLLVNSEAVLHRCSSGRRFPKRPHHQLVAKANFDGEPLHTEHTKHTDAPKFNTELAWEIDKKSLHQHRLQRTPIKVQVCAIETKSLNSEAVGYFILDLRTASNDSSRKEKGTSQDVDVKNQKASWHSLLTSKYQHLKPELKVTLSIEVDQVKANENKKPTSPKLSPSQQNDEEYDVVLDNDHGYYLIGPETSQCEIFVLSVAIGEPKNLMKLVPSDFNVKAEDGYYFYYSLFDNDVTNETFYDLVNPTVPTERATVRVFTTAQRLEKFLKRKRTLDIYLCSGESSLGHATVALDPLIVNAFNTPGNIEGLFRVSATRNTDPRSYSDQDAFIGVAIQLRKESHKPVETISVENPLAKLSPVAVQEKERVSSAAFAGNDVSPLLKLTPPKSTSRKEKDKIQQKTPQKQQNTQHSEDNHHIQYSIDLRSISNLDITNPVNCVCRYNYPYFGSASPIITNPPVLIHRNSEVLLPQSFCKFEFASTMELLKSTLARVPLIVEVWCKDIHMKDELLGITQVNLSEVFNPDNKGSYGPLVKSQKVSIVSAKNPAYRIGMLHVVIGFEDRGIVHQKLTAHHEQEKGTSQDVDVKNQSVSTLSSTDTISGPQPSKTPRDTQEYQVAMALEMWREQQEEHFKAQLSSKENERMKTLADEWKKRDFERQMILKRKMEEYNELELKLKNTLRDLERREKVVREKEEHLERNENLLEDDYQRKTQEMREASRRLKDEYQHQLHLERVRYADLEEKYKRETHLNLELTEKIKQREDEIYTLKESMLQRPEVKLQSDMNLLLVEKNELERKIESITKSKIHYKQQWGRALRELARIKVTEQDAAKSRLKKQQQELEHMKLRYRAIEEQEMMQKERVDLQTVKDEVNQKLEDFQSNMKNIQQQQQQQQQTVNVPSHNFDEGFPEKNRIAKLIEERDTLLQTGVYTNSDLAITELEKEIQQVISQSHS